MRRSGRVDANHGAVAEFFRAHGCEVESLAPMGRGVPDLLVGWCKNVALVEVKVERGHATPDQAKFMARFPVWIVRTDADAREVVACLKRSEGP
ncbi:MAG: hypothetical protein NUW22_12335 [Acidobacteria bacterium]|nr:hypothetical protein [Acidobacteriota bacterium]